MHCLVITPADIQDRDMIAPMMKIARLSAAGQRSHQVRLALSPTGSDSRRRLDCKIEYFPMLPKRDRM